jgi:proteasome lid subunit RPN8/RPN11
MDTPFRRLVIPQNLHDEIVVHAQSELPNECCGVLAGTIENDVGTVTYRFAVRNDLASPVTYHTNARDLLLASRAARETGTEWLAIYHSHPSSPAVPSRTDLAENTYGTTVAHVIVSLADEEPALRGWWLGDERSQEAELVIRVPLRT